MDGLGTGPYTWFRLPSGARRFTSGNPSRSARVEGTAVGQADVREVQGHQEARAGHGDLLEPEAQAAAGIGGAWLGSPASTFPARSGWRSRWPTSTGSDRAPRGPRWPGP